MAVNKVVDRNYNVLIDLTNDTVKATDVISGKKFHGADGKEYVGSLQPNELDSLKYTFIDYDGEVMYTFTDAEIDAMTELPAGPDHTDDNLTFQEWNWSLEDLKAWDRTRGDRPVVGATLITTDRKTYIDLDIPIKSSFNFSASSINNPTKINIDWGDGSSSETIVSTNTLKHEFQPGEYTITVSFENLENSTSASITFGDTYSLSSTKAIQYIKRIRMGDFPKFGSNFLKYSSNLESINLPEVKLYSATTECLVGCYSLKALVLPKNSDTFLRFSLCGINYLSIPNVAYTNQIYLSANNLKSLVFPNGITRLNIQNCFEIRDIYIPDSVTDLSLTKCTGLKNIRLSENLTTMPSLDGCNTIENVTIPSNITTLPSYFLASCFKIRRIVIPDNVQTLQSSCFNYLDSIIIDLTQQTKVPTLTSSLSGTSRILLVPASLLSQFKTASYWSNYASEMVGV